MFAWSRLKVFVFLIAAASLFVMPMAGQNCIMPQIPCDAGTCTVSVPGASITVAAEASPGTFLDADGFVYKKQGGLAVWNVRGVNRAFAQGSFYRLGGQTRETDFVVSPEFDAQNYCMDPAAQRIYATYDGGTTPVKVEVVYTLLGKMPGRESLVLKDVRVTNKTASPFNLNWFDYTDFDLSSFGLTDAVSSHLHAGSTRVITQTGAGLSILSQWPSTSQDGNFLFNQPAAFQVAVWGAHPSSNLLSSLQDNTITTLTSAPDRIDFQNDDVHAVEFRFSGVIDNVIMRMSSTAMLVGDVNGDGVVDMNDLQLINAALNQSAAADDPRDLDRDGMITVLDARKLVLSCTHPRCAVQ